MKRTCNQKWKKTLTAVTVMFALCACMSISSLAGDSIWDFLVSYSSEEGETQDTAEAKAYTEDPNTNRFALGDVVFSLPGNMLYLADQDGTLFFGDDPDQPSRIVLAEYMESKGDNIDLSNEQNQQQLVQGIAGAGGSVTDYVLTMIDEKRAMEILYEQSEDGGTIYGHGLVVELDDAMFLITIMSESKLPDYELYDYLKYTTHIDAQEAFGIDNASVHSTSEAPKDNGETTAEMNTMDSQMFVDNDILSISVTGDLYLLEGSDESYLNLPVHIENRSAKTIMVQCFNSESGVNGAVVRTITPQVFIAPGETIDDNIFWLVSELNAAGIDPNNVRTVTFDYFAEEITEINDGVGQTGDILAAESVTFQVH